MKANVSVAKPMMLSLSDTRSWGIVSLSLVGSIVLPQVCHLIPGGGLAWLPIYFFTLIISYIYGWKAGIALAVTAPIVNFALFGMPDASSLPIIEIKGILLAVATSYVAIRARKVSFLGILGAVVFYQVIGSSIESLVDGSLYAGFQDFKIGYPGMLLQVIGGYFVIKLLTK